MRKNIMAGLLWMVPLAAGAGTLDQIARLEQHKGDGPGADDRSRAIFAPGSPPGPVVPIGPSPSSTAPVWFLLADGRRVDVSHWQIVHFIRSDCPYCHRFNPVLKSVAAQTGLRVFVYSFDGVGDAIFPHVLPVNDAVVQDFFAELPRATPTDFLINTQSLVTLPLSQGVMTAATLKQRIRDAFALALHLAVL